MFLIIIKSLFRLFRMVRLIRMVKLYKYAQAIFSDGKTAIKEREESHVGAAMTDLTNRRHVIIYIYSNYYSYIFFLKF